MNSRTLLAFVALILTLVACNPTRTPPPTITPTIFLFVSAPAGITTLTSGEEATISWRVNNATTVLVTSNDNNLTIPANTAHEGSITTTFTRTTVFTVTADDSVKESLTITVIDPEEEDEDDDSPGGEEFTLEVLNIELTNGAAPATATITGKNLPADFTDLGGDYTWALYLRNTSGGWGEIANATSPELTHSFAIANGGTYRVTLTHPERPNTETRVEFTIPTSPIDLAVTPFPPGEHSTTIHVTNNYDWELTIPEWLTSPDELNGTGDATITVILPNTTQPGAYEGEVTLNTTTPDTYHPTEVRSIHFAFTQVAGAITTPWTATTATTRPQSLQATTASLPALPHLNLNGFTRTPGSLAFLFHSHLQSAAEALRSLPEVSNATILSSLNMITVTTTDMKATATAGATLPGFKYVEEHVIHTPAPMQVTDLTDYDLAPVDYFGTEWYNHPQGHFIRQNITALHDMGLTGDGITIAIVDRGFQQDHELYGDRVLGYYRTELDEYDNPIRIIPSDPLPAICDNAIHGLTVTSVAAGENTHDASLNTGVATGANLILIDMLEPRDGQCLQTGISIIQLADFLINDGNPRAQIVNASWGLDHPDVTYDPTLLDNIAFTEMRNHGIHLVAAAGNNVYANRVSWPAFHPDIIAVGSLNPFAEYPVSFEYEEPGLNLLSTHGMTGYPNSMENGELHYGVVAGTSVAAPQVAGIIALLLEHNPNLTPDEVQNALEATAHKALDDGTNTFSVAHGVVDALAALTYLEDPNHIPYHQLSILLNGTPIPRTVRPDGTFLTPYLPDGNYELMITTSLQSSIGDFSAAETFTAASNTPISDLPRLDLQLTRD